jgi:splicing factor, arginine/serine-rich 7
MTKVYVGGIPNDTKQEEVEDAFSKYGKIESVWLARNPPGFAFVTYEDARDADDAIREMDGREFLGRK